MQGGPPVSPAQEAPVGPVADAAPFTAAPKAQVVSALIGPQGGTLEVTSETGNRFLLTLPPGALEEETNLTMVPVALTGLGVEVLGAVQCGPAGTRFTIPGELVIELVDGVDPASLVAFTVDDTGGQRSLMLSRVEGNRLILPVQHFSIFGYFEQAALEAWTDSIINDPNLPPPEPEETLASILATIIWEDPLASGGTILQVLRDHFNTSLLPALEAAASADDRLVVFLALRRYLHFVQCVEFSGGQISEFEPVANPRVVALLKRMIALEGGRMVQLNNIDYATKILRWYAAAQQLNLATAENGLDLDSIGQGLPIQLVTRPDDAHGEGPHPDDAEHFNTLDAQGNRIPFPKIIDQGEQKDLNITCGYRLGGNRAMSDKPVRMTVQFEGGDPQLVQGLDTVMGQRTTSESVDLVTGERVVQVVTAPQFESDWGTLATPLTVKLADNSDGINIIVDASLSAGTIVFVKKRFTLRVEGKLFMAPLAGPTTMARGSTAGVQVALLRKGTRILRDKEVTFRVTGGGSFNPAQVVTDANGTATVQYTAPPEAGQVTIEASYVDGEQTVRETLTIDIRPPQLAPTWIGTHTGVTTQFNNNPPSPPGPTGSANLTLQVGNEFTNSDGVPVGRLVTGGTLTFSNGNDPPYWTVRILSGNFLYTGAVFLNCRREPFDPNSQGGTIRAVLSADETALTQGTYEEVVQTILNRIVHRNTFELTRQ